MLRPSVRGGKKFLRMLYNDYMSDLSPIKQFRLSSHAAFEMTRRQITQDEIASVLAHPEQVELIRPGRAVYQSRVEAEKPPKEYLVRVFVDIDRHPPEVVTVYRTSKIEKYWRQP